MKQIVTLIALAFTLELAAQTAVNNSSYTFSTGVQPTFSVLLENADPAMVEKWYKEQLKAVSADMAGKKEVMSIGTRLPEISSDTIRVFLKADQPKKAKDVTVHAAFRVNGVYVGPDSDARQVEGCRSWMYQRAVMLKKELAQKALDAATKQQRVLEDQLAGLVKEKDRAQNTIEKTQGNIMDDEKAKVETDGEVVTMKTTIDAKKQDVANSATEENTKALQGLIKEEEKLKRKSEKLAKDIASGKKRIEDLQFQIKKNLEDQDAKSKAIDAQKKVVEELTTKLGAIN
ncbi:MAG: hypothetical protein JNM91_04090 [Flavobacteriales bacterium]|nr:hypothetical protein [Flavobacteriales bacterium]